MTPSTLPPAAAPDDRPISPPEPARPVISRNLFAIVALLIVIAGISFRILPDFGVPDNLTLDERLYIFNVRMVQKIGIFQYPAVIQYYLQSESKAGMVLLPAHPLHFRHARLGLGCPLPLRPANVAPLRLDSFLGPELLPLRILRLSPRRPAPRPLGRCAHGCRSHGADACPPRTGRWGLRLHRPLFALAPVGEHAAAQHRLGWLAAYAGSIAFMVLTKENAFFAAVGLCGILGVATLFPGLNIGKATWSTFAATIAGGALGAGVLLCLAGSPGDLIQVYRLVVVKAELMKFAHESGGGPWFHYLVDLMLVSPTVLIPAMGGIFTLRKESRQGIYLLLFVFFSYAVMINVRNGMNLRYATMWDMPLRYLAAGMILQMGDGFRRIPMLTNVFLIGLVALVAGFELHQYWLLFVRHDIGEPITQYLMWATEIVRFSPQQ